MTPYLKGWIICIWSDVEPRYPQDVAQAILKTQRGCAWKLIHLPQYLKLRKPMPTITLPLLAIDALSFNGLTNRPSSR